MVPPFGSERGVMLPTATAVGDPPDAAVLAPAAACTGLNPLSTIAACTACSRSRCADGSAGSWGGPSSGGVVGGWWRAVGWLQGEIWDSRRVSRPGPGGACECARERGRGWGGVDKQIPVVGQVGSWNLNRAVGGSARGHWRDGGGVGWCSCGGTCMQSPNQESITDQ